MALAALLGTLVVFLGSQNGTEPPGRSGSRVSVPTADAATDERTMRPPRNLAPERPGDEAARPAKLDTALATMPHSALPELLFDPTSLIAAAPGPRVAMPEMALRADTLPPAEAATGAIRDPDRSASPDDPRLKARAAAPRLEGTWAVDRAGCRRRNSASIPLVIDGKGARAGASACRFARTQQAGNRWTIAATCRSGQETWAANVKLVLDGAHLTWSSERGTERYQRCR